MAPEMDRRDFLASTPAAMFLATNMINQQSPAAGSRSAATIEPFDYQGVRLRPSRWKEQSDAARDFYFGLSDDDILHGNRADAGLPAPGRVLGGWCGHDSNSVLGQWLSGMSRLYRATGDARMRDKAVTLMTEWAKTVKPDGDAGMRHYPYDKMVCGLVDLQLYAGSRASHSDAREDHRLCAASPSIGRTIWPIRLTTPRTTACRRSGTRCRRTSSAPTG